MGHYEESEHGPASTGPAPDQTATFEEVDALATSKSTKSPAFQFYPKEFLSSTKVIAMSPAERGVYITLLAMQWLDGSVPNDRDALARLNGMKPQVFAKMWPHTLARCFVERNGRLVNLRLEKERKKQAEFREKQRKNAASRWDKPNDATAVPTNNAGTRQAVPNACFAVSDLQSASASPERTHTPGGAPIHTSHKKHAACGRVCVPADLHSRFVRARNHDAADQELRDWYQLVDDEWSVGAKKDANTGGDDYRFWRARFDETWPDESAAKKMSHAESRLPAWAR